ncbi:hypothetical protein V6N13_123839 [Hibiscus sabdariffa]
MICGNKTAPEPSAFAATVLDLLADLQVATPKINGYFAATKKEVVGDASAGNTTVYGVAQCIETITESGCRDCMQVANTDIQRCPPNTDGRAMDVGCFLRYSDSPFFADNETVDIAPFLRTPSNSSRRNGIIGGVVGGAALLFLVIALLVWFKRWTTSKDLPIRGDILGATELRGPINYKYKDLSAATNKFSHQNKLGEGGFGEVYKGVLKNEKIVAIKKLTITQSQRAKLDYESEVKLISNVHHRNLIRLLGCCNKGPELLLVYEYMKNSSLDKYIFGTFLSFVSSHLTFEIPSYITMSMRLMDGNRQAWTLYEKNMHQELVEESLDGNEYEAEEVKRMVEIGLMCTQSAAALRPSMSQVVVMLKSRGSTETRPITKPTIIDSAAEASTSTASSASLATLSITQISSR